MKKIYICGDSFGCPDLGWNIDPWPVLLAKQLGDSYKVSNLSLSCASNFLIRVQVDKAIEELADFVILLGTSCTREQGKLKSKIKVHNSIYDRFSKVGQVDHDEITRDLACYSMHSLNQSCVFGHDDVTVLKDYHSRLFDLELAVQQNQYIIESSLYTLKENNIPFLFDQGGFENPIFGNVSNKKYFTNFDEHKSLINQWSVADKLPKSNKTHFHILDQKEHGKIADYYYQNIVAFFKKP
jgi:hypothetical protein